MSEHEHAGHRQRLMDKVLADACCEHEFLEMFLCYAIPRRNTNDLAHRLLSRFGGMPQILRVTPEQLQAVDGVGKNVAALLCCMGKFCQDYADSSAIESSFPESYDTANFLSYLKDVYANLKSEILDVYLVDENGKIFRRERYSSGQNDMVFADTETFSLLLAASKPSGVILVHNHPYGKPVPSENDDLATKNCACICSAQHVLLCNHFIVSPQGIYDYYHSGKLAPYTRDYALSSLLKDRKERVWEE